MRISPFPRPVFTISAIVGVLVVVGSLLVYAQSSPLERQAKRIVQECASYAANIRENCYMSAVPALYPSDSVAQLFSIISELQALDPSYTSCHLTAHAIGARVADEDPEHWTDGVHESPPDSPCDGGFLHGLLSERFSAEVLSTSTIQKLVPVFQHVCDPTESWQPSALDQYECYHGMGHLYVFVTNGDMPQVMKLCQETVPAFFKAEGPRLCYNGAFMEILTPTGPDGFEIQKNLPVRITPDSVSSYCRDFIADPMQYGTCLQRGILLQWPPSASANLEDLCKNEPPSEQQYCMLRVFKNLAYDISGHPESDPAICNIAPADERDLCYGAAALIILKDSSTLENARSAIAFCGAIKNAVSANGCMDALASHGAYFYGQGSASLKSYCNLFSGTRRAACNAAGVGTYF